MPPRLVKPCMRSQKNDPADAEAIAEVVTRPTTVESGALDRAAHERGAAGLLPAARTRDPLIRQRGRRISARRAHFAELGLIALRTRNLDLLLTKLQPRADRLPSIALEMLGVLAAQLRA